MAESQEDLIQSLPRLKAEIEKMQRDTTHGPKKPHKLVMLLAVVDLFEKGLIKDNKIFFDSQLIESFSTIFNLIRIKREWNQPAPPFFHLRTSRFWHHQIISGREIDYKKLTTSGGGSKRILDNIEYVYLSDYCFQIMCDKESRQDLKEFLISALNPYASFAEAAPVNPLIGKRG